MIVKYIQRSRKKGYSLDKECERLGVKRENVVFCGRGSKWGNPFKLDDIAEWGKKYSCKAELINTYKRYMYSNAELINNIKEQLKGKTLMCWCSKEDFENGLCHCSVLWKIANNKK